MKKITMIVNGVSDTTKAKFKEKRIFKALEIATLNAQESLETAKSALEEFPANCGDMDAETIVESLAQLISDRKDAEYSLEVLDEVKKYLDEDVEESAE